ncbi:MAG: LysM peptidoglycan-binding domain-containing protein [Bacillota bacterium]|nr:hypothetical protein [Bacillota bacterium]
MHQEDNRGLRFHVREQIHLPDDVPEIEAIRELELEPVVEVTAAGGSVTVSGFLSLTGKYLGRREHLKMPGDGSEAYAPFPFHPLESEMGPLAPWQKRGEIRHRIPLDITVPEERVPDLEDVYVVIDSFDYEVQGPRKLAIEAVLDVTGIEVERGRAARTVEQADPVAPVLVSGTEPVPSGRERAETAETPAEVSAKADPVLLGDDAQAEGHRDAAAPVADEREAGGSSAPEGGSEARASVEPEASQAVEAAAATGEPVDLDGRQAGDADAHPAGDDGGSQARDEPAETQPEPQPDVKVAITAKSKPEESSARSLSSVLMGKGSGETQPAEPDTPETAEAASPASAAPSSIDGEDHAEAEATAASGGQQAAEAEVAEAAGKPENGRYLIGLLKEKEERYARLTMCIVHRNDTLAAIAARYGVSADTIRTVNGMADDHLEEGQILLIPRREG